MVEAGYNRAIAQVRAKVKYLRIRYFKARDNLKWNGTSGEPEVPHFKIIDSFLGAKPKANPHDFVQSSGNYIDYAFWLWLCYVTDVRLHLLRKAIYNVITSYKISLPCWDTLNVTLGSDCSQRHLAYYNSSGHFYLTQIHIEVCQCKRDSKLFFCFYVGWVEPHYQCEHGLSTIVGQLEWNYNWLLFSVH